MTTTATLNPTATKAAAPNLTAIKTRAEVKQVTVTAIKASEMTPAQEGMPPTKR